MSSFLVDTKPVQKLLATANKDETTFAKLGIKDSNSAWEYYGLHENAKKWIVIFYDHHIGDLRLFARSWEIALENVSCPDSFVNLDLIVARVGVPCFDQLKEFLMLLDDGRAETNLIDIYLRMPVYSNNDTEQQQQQVYDFDQQKLQSEIWILYKVFKIKSNISDGKKDVIVKKLTVSCLCYLKVKTLAKVYKNILKLKTALALTGNFIKIENLDNLVGVLFLSISLKV